MNQRHWLKYLVFSAGGASAWACGGGEFCAESRTCVVASDDAAGAGGAAAQHDGGSPNAAGTTAEPDAGAGGAGASDLGTGGAGGDPVSTTVGLDCVEDPDCDDHDSCTGEETCEDNVCVAGEAVACDLGMECAAEQGNACVWSSSAPWIVYVADDDQVGLAEAFAIKLDLLGKRAPVKLVPKLAAGLHALRVGSWSPDHSAAIVFATDELGIQSEAYLVRFGDGLPEAVHLTQGLTPSEKTWVKWAPSGQVLGVERDDGFYVFPATGTDGVRASPDTMSNVVGWFKSDDELVLVGANVVSSKWSILLAERDANAWNKSPLASNLTNLTVSTPSPDGSTLGYVILESLAPLSLSLWSVETTLGSQPAKIAGPATDLAFQPAPDFKRYLLATTLAAGTDVFGGPLATLSAPPLLKEKAGLTSLSVIGDPRSECWALDSSRAAVFQQGSFGRQLVIHDPLAAEKWHALSGVETTDGGFPAWSHDGKALALPTQTSKTSTVSLTLVSVPGYAKYTALTAVVVHPGPFSAEDDFLYYRATSKETSNSAPEDFETGYIDLRDGLDQAGAPTPLPGPVTSFQPSTVGADLLYIRSAADCFYLDLSGKTAAEPVQVNGSGTVVDCTFQPPAK